MRYILLLYDKSERDLFLFLRMECNAGIQREDGTGRFFVRKNGKITAVQPRRIAGDDTASCLFEKGAEVLG